jgi:hypothetical protein
MPSENNTNVPADVIAEFEKIRAEMKALTELYPFVPQAVQMNGCGNGNS